MTSLPSIDSLDLRPSPEPEWDWPVFPLRLRLKLYGLGDLNLAHVHAYATMWLWHLYAKVMFPEAYAMATFITYERHWWHRFLLWMGLQPVWNPKRPHTLPRKLW